MIDINYEESRDKKMNIEFENQKLMKLVIKYENKNHGLLNYNFEKIENF